MIHQLESVRLGTHATGWSATQVKFTLADSSVCWREGVRPRGEGWVWEMAFTRALGQSASPGRMRDEHGGGDNVATASLASTRAAEKPRSHPSVP